MNKVETMSIPVELPITWGCDSFDDYPILSDLDGIVHGIKSLSPCIIQCDGCGKTVQGEKLGLTVLTSGITFNPRLNDGRRMCEACWKDAGWVDDPSRGWLPR